MNKNLVEVAIIIDKSGSMEGLREQTVKGFNDFLTEQKQVDKETRCTLVFFSSAGLYEVMYDSVPIADVPELTYSQYQPTGLTALNDAIGKTVTNMEARIKTMKKKYRPGKVVVAILTDGQENDSSDYSQTQVAALIQKQTDKKDWGFVYLAANQNAKVVGASYNMTHSINFVADASGLELGMKSLSRSISSMSQKGNGNVSESQKSTPIKTGQS